MKRSFCALPPLLLLVLLPGCRHRAAPRPAAVVAPAALVRTAGGLTGSLTVTPLPPTPMKPATLRLELRDAAGSPVAGRHVVFDLTMPAMAMPPNHPPAAEKGQGTYEAKAVFTMSGAWEIEAEVSGQAGPVALVFPLDVP